MRVSAKKILLLIFVAFLTSIFIGTIVWSAENTVIEQQKKEISLLESQVSDLSNQITQKLAEKKAQEEAEALAAEQEEQASNNIPTKRTTGSSTPTPVAENTPTTDPATEPESTPEPEEPESPILYYFFDPDCGACMIQTPVVQQVEAEGVPVAYMDVDAHPSYISQYGLEFVPTFIVNDHKEVAIFTKEELMDFWNTYK